MNLAWGYDPVSFFSVEYNYYNDDSQPLDKLFRLQLLINELHKRNIHVIMDGVFNHAKAGVDPNKGFAYFWLYENPEDSPYIGSFGEGGFFNEFDFANNCTDQFIIDVCKYWINEYCIDGIRFDYVKGFYVPDNPSQGIAEIILHLKQFARAKRLKNITFTLELLPDNRYEAIDETNKIGATGCWYDPLLWQAFDISHSDRLPFSLLRALHSGKDFDLEKRPVTYLENHDHSTLTEWYRGRNQWWLTQPLLIALFTISGAPFIHNGQEFGEQYWFPETGEGRVMRRPLRWDRSTDEIGQSLISLYQQLIAIRKSHYGFSSLNFYPDFYVSSGSFNSEGYGMDIDRRIIIYHRWGNDKKGKLERFIVVLNLSSSNQTVSIPFSENGNWYDLLNNTLVQVT